MRRLIFVVIFTLLLASCSVLQQTEEMGEVRFQLMSGAKEISSDTVEGPGSLMISIRRCWGRVEYEREIVELYSMGGGYISEPLSLRGGEYELTEFLVMDHEKHIKYAAPIEGSNKAYLVYEPLPIGFYVHWCETTTVSPEVLHVRDATPEDFGYEGFSFDIVETIVFKVEVYEWTEEGKELTEAKMTVTSGAEELYSGGLEAGINEIEVRDRYGTYKVTVEKDDYDSYEEIFTDEKLESFFEDPLIIYFGEALTHSISGQVTFDTVMTGVIGFRGVTMTLSGDASAIVTTDASGYYTFSDLAEGESYTVSANKPGYAFSPDWAGTLVDDVKDADFTALLPGPSYSISGHVIGGATVSGVEMTLDTTPPLTVFTEEWGSYETVPVPNGTYILTPSLPGSNVAFYPSEKTLTVENSNLTDENFNATFTYTVSGDISYSGNKSGWVYINVVINEWDSQTGVGTGIEVTGQGSWPFTIRGVQPGEYTLIAHMDNIGTGDHHFSNPGGSSEIFPVEDSDVTGLTIDLTDQDPITPEVPAIMAVFPSNQSAWVLYEAPMDEEDNDEEGNEIAQFYNVYWGFDENVSKTSYIGMGSFPVNDMDLYIAHGLDDGEDYYFVITAVADGTESEESEFFGPVTIGAASGNNTVEGTITLGQEPTGPMYVMIYGETDEDFVARGTYIASPTSSQPYSMSGVPDGTYMFLVLVDMNDNGILEWNGDIHMGFEEESYIVVSGYTIHNLTIGAVPGAFVEVTTSHEKYGELDNYSLNFDVNGGWKQVVKASLMSGPGIPGVIDISCMQEHEERISLYFYSISPGVGDTYTIDLTYSDGTEESMQASVTGVVESFATPISPNPIDVPGGTEPIFSWNAPAPPPSDYGYAINVWESGGGGIWWTDEISGSVTSVEYNFNDEAEQDSLTPGITYSWDIAVIDAYGNSARSGSIEFTP